MLMRIFRKTVSINRVIQLKLEGEDPFYIDLKDGKAEFYEGEAEKPNYTIKTTAKLWKEILQGE
ncbi:MAG: SCP2 sterol-binding domain-containing protein [Candidatus Baldrarchaeia archaeon]